MKATAALAMLIVGCSGKDTTPPPEPTHPTDTGDPTDTPTDTTTDTVTEPGPHSVGGTVTGLTHPSVRLSLNGGAVLEVDADGPFTFPIALGDGDAYTVEVLATPSCPTLACDLANGDGVVAGADVTDIEVTCHEPPYRMVSYSWGDDVLRITDDVASFDDGEVAVPRIVTPNPALTTSDSVGMVAIDTGRDVVYVGSVGTVSVFAGLASLEGVATPVRTITVGGYWDLAIALDVAGDRLYASAGDELLVFEGASQLDGNVVPSVIVPHPSSGRPVYDAENDRLYVLTRPFGALAVDVFDAASALGPNSVPDRQITWSAATGPMWLYSIDVDPCTDRLYLGSNVQTASGFGLVVFEGASTLDGPVDFELDSVAQLANQLAIHNLIDDGGRLYVVEDSASTVKIYDAPDAWAGTIDGSTDRDAVGGLVSSCYSYDVVPY